MVHHSSTNLYSMEGYLSDNHQYQIFTAQQICVALLHCVMCTKLDSVIVGKGLEGRIWRALELFVHSVAKTLLPPWKVVGATLLQHLAPRFW